MSLTILGLESSCDETAAAVLQGGCLKSNKMASQAIHAQYGGVVPELAARAHQTVVVPVVDAALREAGVTLEELDAVAVTQGPGLLGGLLVGVAFANGLGMAQEIPVLGIHHVKAHLLANFLGEDYPTFPFLGVVVSGGHTQLMRVENSAEMRLLGRTLDDAVGEAFDKIAKMMGMPYPGGVHIDRRAAMGDSKRFNFPITNMSGLDFSFSGIKTAFLYFLRKKKRAHPQFLEDHLNDLCASVQAVLVEMVMIKVVQAMEETGLKRIVLGGGVACNRLLRKRLLELKKNKGWKVFLPAPPFCTDNAAMIAMAGHFALAQPETAQPRYIFPMPRMPL